MSCYRAFLQAKNNLMHKHTSYMNIKTNGGNVSPLNIGVIVLQFVIVASPLRENLLYVDT